MENSLKIKKSEWDQKAEATSDLCRQVGRIVSQEEFLRLIEDVKTKLMLDGRLESILDVGCGNAVLLGHLRNLFQNIYGTDFSANMIIKARSVLPEGFFSQGEANALRFKDGQFDRVLSYSIFHYFPSVEYGYQAIDEMIRVCKKGGILLIGDVLDKRQESLIKGGSDMEYEKKIPHIGRYSEWLFFDLPQLKKSFSDKGHRVEILDQPNDFKLGYYRKDVRIWV